MLLISNSLLFVIVIAKVIYLVLAMVIIFIIYIDNDISWVWYYTWIKTYMNYWYSDLECEEIEGNKHFRLRTKQRRMNFRLKNGALIRWNHNLLWPLRDPHEETRTTVDRNLGWRWRCYAGVKGQGSPVFIIINPTLIDFFLICRPQ